jgi:prevent-host-death family protein
MECGMAEYSEFVPLSQAKARLSSLVRKVKEEQGSYAITHRGKPEGVLLSIGEYETLIETLAILSDRELMARLDRGLEDEKKGRLYTHEEVFPKK